MAYNVVEKQIEKKLKRINLSNITHRVYECPICGSGKVEVANSVFYGRCDQCGATVLDFVPLDHQAEYFLSDATYKLLIGGYGSGKTTIACFSDAYHALTVPDGKILITAPTLQQMRVAVLPELEKFLPPWFLIGGRSKGNPPIYRLTNGHEIHVYPSDNEQKIRSINLTRFHIEEGSGVPKNIFDQLQARLRNSAAIIYDEHGYEVGNRFSGDISTNPEDSWIKDDFLLKSFKLHGSRSIDIAMYDHMMHSRREPLFETFISASFDNTMLPKGTIERISAGKDERWKRKYLWCYLDSKEGLVYPDLFKYSVEPFDIPHNWKRLGAYDPGISDPTAMLIAAVDPKDNVIYIYKEYYVKDKPITYHGTILKPFITPYSWLRPIYADPSVNKRSQHTLMTYKSYFKQVTGITLQPANNDLLYGIDKVRDYLYQGKIKFFNNLEEFKRESSVYAFPNFEDKNFKNINNKPIDRDNHLMDCLRYMIVHLPNNPGEFRQSYQQEDVLRQNAYFGTENSDTTSNGKFNEVIYGFKR